MTNCETDRASERSLPAPPPEKPARGRPAAFLVLVLLLTVIPGCENIEWGGSDVQIVPPPPASGAVRIAPDAQAFAQFGMPTGTVLFHLVRRDGNVRLIPIAELSGDSLRTLRRPADVSPDAYEERFRETVIPAGSQYEVFRRGASVGTFNLQGAAAVTPCGLPTATGNLTTVAAAADADEFLAFRRGLAPEVRGEYTPPQVNSSIRTYASIVAERLILQNGLPRPRSWGGAQRDLQAIEIMPGGNPEMATTYLVGDSLAAGPGDPQGYSVFYIADYETRRGYTPIYSEVHNYSQGGKLAPRFVDYLDWNSDGGEEILVQMYRPTGSGYKVLSQQNGAWRQVWEGGGC